MDGVCGGCDFGRDGTTGFDVALGWCDVIGVGVGVADGGTAASFRVGSKPLVGSK